MAWAVVFIFVHIGFPRTFDLECGIQHHALFIYNRNWVLIAKNFKYYEKIYY